MNLLLDTCVFLWALQEPARLSPAARRALQDPRHQVAVSVVSFWEISLKHGLGKLTLDGIAPEAFPAAADEAGWEILPLPAEVAASSGRLPRLAEHRDPFDRLLVWQALRSDHTLVSRDGLMRGYIAHGLKLCW